MLFRSTFELFNTEQNEPSFISADYTPRTFEQYLGQAELKKKLTTYAQAAKQRKEALDHTLLFGPPGLGKTTLATILSHELNVGIKICSGPMLERTGDLVAILTSLEPRDIFFIDEIHRMATAVEEVLYSAMEQFSVDVIIGQGTGAKSVNLPLSPFTLVGATTKSGMLSAPLRSRFGIIERLEFYTPQELQIIVAQNAQALDISLSQDAALRIAHAARGTPRIAKKLVRRIRDISQVNQQPLLDDAAARQMLAFLGIDDDGLSKLDNALIKALVIRFNGGPVGLETLAALLGEDAETIEEVYEPFLLRKGYIEKTSRGRQIPYNALPYFKSKFCGQQTIINPAEHGE